MYLFLDKLRIDGKQRPRSLFGPGRFYEPSQFCWVDRSKITGPELMMSILDHAIHADVYLHNYRYHGDIEFKTPEAFKAIANHWNDYDHGFFMVEFTKPGALESFTREWSHCLTTPGTWEERPAGETPPKHDKPDEPHPTLGKGFWVAFPTGAEPRIYYLAN